MKIISPSASKALSYHGHFKYVGNCHKRNSGTVLSLSSHSQLVEQLTACSDLYEATLGQNIKNRSMDNKPLNLPQVKSHEFHRHSNSGLEENATVAARFSLPGELCPGITCMPPNVINFCIIIEYRARKTSKPQFKSSKEDRNTHLSSADNPC